MEKNKYIRKRKLTSKIWSLTKEEIQNYCNQCDSFRDLLSILGYRNNSGTMFNKIKTRIKTDNIDISHFNKMQGDKCGKIQTSDILVENSTYSRYHLKTRLIKEGLLEYKCTICNNYGVWLENSLKLQLEHKNGNPTDNRIENLEFLCPNCHSQTSTYCGRNKLIK